MTIVDQLDRKITFKDTPKRIVSLVPSLTELLIDLGLEASVIGITKFCIHPKHLSKEKIVVGGTKMINLEKIKALQPDIILCNKEENTVDIISTLEKVAPIHISDIYNITDVYNLINAYGKIFDVNNCANKIIKQIEQERQSFKAYIKTKIDSKKRVAYFIWKNPWMVAANNTFIDFILNDIGFGNAYRSNSRYPEINIKAEKLKEIDYIFLSSEPFPFKQKHVQELKTLLPNTNIKIVDGEMFSWYGSRLIKSYAYFKTLR